jgi:hypothetical protein
MPRRVLAPAVVLGAGLASAVWLGGRDVRIGPRWGDWAAASAGLSRSSRGASFTAGRRAVVHFHDLGPGPAEVVVAVSSRDPANPASLRVFANGEQLFELEPPAEPTLVTVPVREGMGTVEVGFEAVTARETSRPAWRIHQVVLRRASPSIAPCALPGLIGLAVFWGLARRTGTWVAAGWGIAAAVFLAGLITTVHDPVLALRLAPHTRDVLRVAALGGLWALALASPGSAAAWPAVVGTVGILYLPSLGYGFLNEDFSFARAWSFADLRGVFHGSWFPQKGVIGEYYRPLVSLSFAFDSALWGARTAGYHSTNLALHVVNGLLAVRLLERLGLASRAALLGGLAFVAHPLGTIAAVWFSERTDGMMAVFYLAVLVVLLASPFTLRRATAVLALATLALGCKEMAVTLPVTAALVAWCVGGTELRRRVRIAAALAGVVATYAAFWAWLFPHKLLAGPGRTYAWEGFEPHRAADWLSRLPRLYGPLFAPVGYERWWTGSPSAVPAVVALIGVSFLAWRLRAETAARVLLVGLIWPLATVWPILAISEVDLYRLGLLIAVGLGLCFGAIVDVVSRHRAWPSVVLAGLMAAWLAPPALATAAAWGPGGFVMSLLPGFKRHFGAEWWDPLTPEMKRLYYDQLDRQDHAAAWVAAS